MKSSRLMRVAALAAVLAAPAAFAQTAAPSPAEASPVVTDVGPAPAHERSSIGAVVLDNSLVRAQRDRDFETDAKKTGVASVGRSAVRATMKAKVESELAQAREEEAAEVYRRGAAGITAK